MTDTAREWTFTDTDAGIAEELSALLPERLFDAHAHIYRVRDLNLAGPSIFSGGDEEVTPQVWSRYVGMQCGESRLTGGLFFGAPTAGCDIDAENDFVLAQLASSPESRGLILVTPDFRPEEVADCLGNPQVVGFKPYHLFSSERPTFQSSIGGYLPEWVWEMAEASRLIIMLHLVRDGALADQGNQGYIQEMCARYPNAKLVLAHCARGFHAPNTASGVNALAGLDNVWFDTSAVCEAGPIAAILKRFGPRRLLWGSDFPISLTRGRCVTVGDSFSWICPTRIDQHESAPECRPTLVGLESLRALVEAADGFGASDVDMQDIFRDNARRLLGMEEAAGSATQSLYAHARKRIPGGVQLLSKRPEMMAPAQWPAYFREARGCETWDIDGRHYYDMATNGIGSCLLGFGDPDVTRAIQRRIALGSMCTLNPPEEVELADILCELHPWAEQVRFARAGGEACAIAVRIARATTDRSVVAICGYHGWHDWYLAANLGESDALRGHLLPGLDPLGVPRELRGTTVAFSYNNVAEFDEIIARHGDRLAAVVMEPCRYTNPAPGFLEHVRDQAHKAGALLIFDEITIGWRLRLGGAHLRFGVNPDIAVFAKALGNGFPVAAVIGTAAAMDGAHSSFISSTYWTESIGCTAGLATLRKMMTTDVPAHVASVGESVMASWKRHGERHGLPLIVGDGYPCLAHFAFEHELANELRTLYTQSMLDRGFLAGGVLYPTLAHTEEIVARYDAAIDEVFAEIAAALASGDVEARLRGPVAGSGFARLT